MLTDEQIKQFEDAMKGPAPVHDPNWLITGQLVKIITVQSKQLINLQSQLDAMTRANTASTNALITSIQRTANSMGAVSNNLTPMQIESAVRNLNEAITAASRGQQAARYVGNVLKFIAKIVL
ncbi:hypothetical protein [Beggiatoa leptomitoformis]|uniref:Uncharacterized protein n=1 Tax=Beggiatoa leptomitoformis TaxID=288004 RepID=A0A2N9YG64_9GAMM|nr:hypothetical protein [Beggiatoa leptomitoformis]ALG68223.1 hypothetical protein AL038_11495 [Beggiatoa leptomitoformis]AUI69473.1 hypothetical protein BLE401_12780 [Beggiatoa leptomitoformis]